jgi:hypothetical protein
MKALWGMGVVVLLAGCGGPPPVLFDGIKFKGKVAAISDDKRDFAVTVRDAAGKAAAAAQAARYEATLYCMDRFAGSDVVWADGVLQDADALVVADGTLVRQGRCVQR